MKVLYFSADWCGPCKMFKPIVEQVSRETGVPVNYINVDYDASFTQRYSVTSVPTMIIAGDDGSEWHRQTGPTTAQQLKDTFSRFR